MFSNFAWSEMLIIAVVAILVVGPKDLPGMLRTMGKTMGNLKRMAGDFQRQFNDAIQEADLDDVKNMTSSKGFAPLEDAKRSMEEFAKSMEEPVETEPASEIEAPAVQQAKPAAKKPATKKAAAKKPATKKASSAKAAPTKTSAAKKPASKKPAAQKSTAQKSTAKTAAKAADKAKSTS